MTRSQVQVLISPPFFVSQKPQKVGLWPPSAGKSTYPHHLDFHNVIEGPFIEISEPFLVSSKYRLCDNYQLHPYRTMGIML